MSAARAGQVRLLQSRGKGQPGGCQGGGGPARGKRTVRAVKTKGKSKNPAFNQKVFISAGEAIQVPPLPPQVKSKQKTQKEAGGINTEENLE